MEMQGKQMEERERDAGYREFNCKIDQEKLYLHTHGEYESIGRVCSAAHKSFSIPNQLTEDGGNVST